MWADRFMMSWEHKINSNKKINLEPHILVPRNRFILQLVVRLLLITVEKLLLENLHCTQFRKESLQIRFRKGKHFKVFIKYTMEREFSL